MNIYSIKELEVHIKYKLKEKKRTVHSYIHVHVKRYQVNKLYIHVHVKSELVYFPRK